MKLTSKIRMQAVLVGLGAALFFANAAQAQQEMDPTTFETDPAVMSAQASPASQSSAPDGLYAAPVVAPAPSAVDEASLTAQQAEQLSPVAALAFMATLVSVAFIVMLAVSEAQHKRNSQIPA